MEANIAVVDTHGLYSRGVMFQTPSRCTEQRIEDLKPKVKHVLVWFLPGFQAFVLRMGLPTFETCRMRDLEVDSQRRGLLPLLEHLLYKFQHYVATRMWKSLLSVSLSHRPRLLCGRTILIGLKREYMRLCYLNFPCATSSTK